MNKRIPADVEQLMWLIAESGDSNAAQEFERRFPDYRFELMRRMSTVKSLRESKPHSPINVPAFHQVRPVRSTTPRWTLAVAFSLGLGVFAFGSYAITQKLTSKPVPPVTQPVQTNPNPVVNQPQVQPNYGQFRPESVDRAGATQPTRDAGRNSVIPGGGVPPLNEQDRKALAQYEKPQDLSIENAELETVFQLIASTTGLQVEFLPNAKNTAFDLKKIVSIDYHQMSGVEMLRKLAGENGATAIYKEGNTFQIVPTLQFMDLQGQ